MTYDIVYVENGDLVAEFDTHEDAECALAAICEDKPQLTARLGILPMDDDGEPAGAFEPAAEVLAHA